MKFLYLIFLLGSLQVFADAGACRSAGGTYVSEGETNFCVCPYRNQEYNVMRRICVASATTCSESEVLVYGRCTPFTVPSRLPVRLASSVAPPVVTPQGGGQIVLNLNARGGCGPGAQRVSGICMCTNGNFYDNTLGVCTNRPLIPGGIGGVTLGIGQIPPQVTPAPAPAPVECVAPKIHPSGDTSRCVCPEGTTAIGEGCGCSGDQQLQGGQCVALTAGVEACASGKVRNASNECVCPDNQTEQNGSCVATTPAPVPASATASSQEDQADTFASYNASTCEWTPHLPRKIHNAPGCTRSTRNQICVGYVACDSTAEGGGKFIRTATCGSDNCGDSDAVACVNDRSYTSQKPSEAQGIRNYMSNEVRGVIGQ